MSKLRVLTALFVFLRKSKAFWLYPVIIALFIAGLLILLGESSAIGPFIYSMF